jgi:hypothetical protein
VWTNDVETRGFFLSNGLVPRGAGVGCHVAPLFFGNGCLFKIFMESVGIEPRTSPKVQRFGNVWATTSHIVVLLNKGFYNYLSLNILCIFWGASSFRA